MPRPDHRLADEGRDPVAALGEQALQRVGVVAAD